MHGVLIIIASFVVTSNNPLSSVMDLNCMFVYLLGGVSLSCSPSDVESAIYMSSSVVQLPILIWEGCHSYIVRGFYLLSDLGINFLITGNSG